MEGQAWFVLKTQRGPAGGADRLGRAVLVTVQGTLNEAQERQRR